MSDMPRKVLILHAPGTNRDGDLAHAIKAAGGAPEIVPLTRLAGRGFFMESYAMLALPGGFSYGDALGAGKLWALELRTAFHALLAHFVDGGKPVIGICNGFQALVKAGILPGGDTHDGKTTLTFNASGRFECRWVTLAPNRSNPSPWLRGLPPIYCPVAHGEGRMLVSSGAEVSESQVALLYATPDGSPAHENYPLNPNGSPRDIAGVTNAAGNVLGLMPHPEDHIHPFQHPHWTRGGSGGMGVQLFENGLSIKPSS